MLSVSLVARSGPSSHFKGPWGSRRIEKGPQVSSSLGHHYARRFGIASATSTEVSFSQSVSCTSVPKLAEPPLCLSEPKCSLGARNAEISPPFTIPAARRPLGFLGLFNWRSVKRHQETRVPENALYQISCGRVHHEDEVPREAGVCVSRQGGEHGNTLAVNQAHHTNLPLQCPCGDTCSYS